MMVLILLINAMILYLIIAHHQITVMETWTLPTVVITSLFSIASLDIVCRVLCSLHIPVQKTSAFIIIYLTAPVPGPEKEIHLYTMQSSTNQL